MYPLDHQEQSLLSFFVLSRVSLQLSSGAIRISRTPIFDGYKIIMLKYFLPSQYKFILRKVADTLTPRKCFIITTKKSGYAQIHYTHQTKYASMKLVSIPRPRDRLGYCRGATIISNIVVTMIIVCIKWFNHHGKYGSSAFGNTSSRSTNINAQKVTPTNCKATESTLQTNQHSLLNNISEREKIVKKI